MNFALPLMSPQRLGAHVAGVLLGLLALFAAMGVMSWHAAMIDHHDLTQAAVMEIDHHAPKKAPEVDLHQAAHVVIAGWTDTGAEDGFVSVLAMAESGWALMPATGLIGHIGERLLRPPRA